MANSTVIVCPYCLGRDHRRLNHRHMTEYRCPDVSCGATALVDVRAKGSISLVCWSRPPSNNQICEPDPRPAAGWLVRLATLLRRLFKEAI